MTIRLAIIDSHTLTRHGLRQVIAEHPEIEVAGECGTSAEAPGLIAEVHPGVVTIDIALSDGDGLRLARDLRIDDPDLGIVMLTSRADDGLLFQALEAGLSAFVAKTAPVAEVVTAIRHAAVAPGSFTATGLALALARRHSTQAGLALSPRESEVLGLLRDGLAVPAIAAAMFISQSTAKTYISRLYDKLGAANRAQALMIAVHHGLIRYDQDSAGRPPPRRRQHGTRHRPDPLVSIAALGA